MTDVEGTGTEIERVDGSSVVTAIEDPAAVLQRTALVANGLKQFVAQQGLTVKMGQRDYLMVEAWQMVGGFLGVTPSKVETLPIVDQNGNPGWEGRVELYDRSGRLVGSGESECTRSEERWANADDFQVRSMAATRTIGKAFRNTFGFVAKAAGFEATPAEEMQREQSQAASGPPHGPDVQPIEETRKAAARSCVKLCGDSPAKAEALYRSIAKELGGYMPVAAAVALIKAAHSDELEPQVEEASSEAEAPGADDDITQPDDVEAPEVT